MQKKYMIPKNFAVEGMVFGAIYIRNLFETAVFAVLLGVPLFRFTGIPFKAKVYISALLILPVCMVSLIGIHGLSITSFLYDFFLTMREKKAYETPSSKDRIARERNLIRKKHKKMEQMRKIERRRKIGERRIRKKQK